MLNNRRISLILMTAWLALAAAACKKNHPNPPPPPPPSVAPTTPSTDTGAGANLGGAKPVISQFSAEPTTIQRGQASTLRWEVTGNVTSVAIDQTIGSVQNSGVRRVFPADNTTYTLTATGPGGATTSQATVTVLAPIPPPPPSTDIAPPGGAGGTLESRVSGLQDVYFDYDKSDVGGDAQSALTQDANTLKGIFAAFPNASITIEGHCDDRGSAEYNLGLGDRRASAVKDYLVQLGLPADKLNTISYGKERPQCTDQNESCWQKNRRAHFASGQ
jgi:peptidoglycan-associated lipoprotein